MFEDIVNKRSRWRAFWPEVDDVPGAEEAIRLCCWFAFVAAGLAAVVGTVTLFLARGDPSNVVSAIILAVVGVGVRRRWRSAAVAGVIFMVSGLVVLLGRGVPPGVLDMFVLVGFINGVRGTFAYKRLSRSAAQNSSTEIDSARG
jgi:hypothetical protein